MDTIVAIATPPGTGAIATLRMSGPQALAIAGRVFGGKAPGAARGHSLLFGPVHREDGSLLDEVLLAVFHAPRSYTREDSVEISCHGSPYIQQELLALLIRQGARLAEPGEFTQRAFLNGQLDLSQAEAVADLIAAESAAAHRIALQQMRGGFSQEIAHLRERLIHFASLIELELDFGEEDVEFADRQDLKDLVAELLALLRRLADSFRVGNVLKNGVATAIVGRPNAGKSTWLNALLREERAIVSDIAGTTRDTIEASFDIQGLRFRLVDTAGIRDTVDHIEAIGVQRALAESQKAALRLYIFDVAATPLAEALADVRRLGSEGTAPTLVLANKVDRIGPEAVPAWPGDERYFALSAHRPEDVERLRQALFEMAMQGQQRLQSDVVVSNARHYEALLRAAEALQSVAEGLDTGITGDFLAMDIRHALRHLGQITGQIDVDTDILGSIFGKFCIGK